jgi:hypothetical protein
MTAREEFNRKALLHDQAAQLLRTDADRHEAEAKKLRDQATKVDRADET